MKITNTENVHYKPSYVCIYGCSGIGKTTLAKTLPQAETLILDAESGIASLRDTKIDVVSLGRSDDGAMIPEDARYERLLEFNKFIQLPATKAKYKYIVIDSLTEIAQNTLKTMQGKYKGFEAWGNYANAMIQLLKFYRDVGHYTIIFTALEGYIEDEAKNVSAFPNIGGKKTKEYLMPVFDEVFRMVVDAEKQRWLITRTTQKTQAKDRSGRLDEREPPNLGAVLLKMRGE
jgi:phage nucleotide-binding protein